MMIVNPNPPSARPSVPARLPAPTPPAQEAPAEPLDTPSTPMAVDHDWKAVGKAALKGAGLGASSAALGALGHSLRAPAAAVRYAGVASAAVVGTRTAERVYANVMDQKNPLREGSAMHFPKAVGLGAVGLVGGGIAGGLGGTLGGLAGATGGWMGIVVATAAGAAISGGLEFLRQKF